MITTRNIEYVFFIAAIYLFVRAGRLKNRYFISGVGLLTLLIASDKLFLSISLAGSLIILIIYGFKQRWQMVTQALRWFMGAILSGALATLLIKLINAIHITNIIGEVSTPYGLINNAPAAGHGLAYAFLSILTNFGANPAFNTIYPREMFRSSLHNVISFGGPSLILNFFLLLIIIFTVYKLIEFSVSSKKRHAIVLDHEQETTILILGAGIAALLAYLVTDHFYPVDARYITILLFGGFMSLAVLMRDQRLIELRLIKIGMAMSLATLLAIPLILNNYHNERSAVAQFEDRNNTVIQVLKNHPVNTLLGDYWRVIPIKQASQENIKVTPLGDCYNPRQILSSLSWQPDLSKSSFAYLLSLDKGLTDFPECSLDSIVQNFGRPNLNVVISGTIENPKELLLFYDHGTNKNTTKQESTVAASSITAPIAVDELTNTSCNQPTIMNIVAHQDDDLLFMNPDLARDIKSGHCVRTIYITAGDSGLGRFYWLGREQGSQVAYNKMLGKDAIWLQRNVKIGNTGYISISTPKANNKISLIYFHLPDGNINGQGFSFSKGESLQKLYSRQVGSLTSVYGNSIFSADSLTDAITELMHIYQPAEIRTQSTTSDKKYQDHSDHMSVGRFVKDAYHKYETEQYNNEVVIPLKYYLGYSGHTHEPNLSSEDVINKLNIFLDYAKYDGSVCHTQAECLNNQAYGAYLTRQYIVEE